MPDQLGDLVLIKTKFQKQYNCPTGVVVDVETNDLDEVVNESIRKANKEVVRHHVSDIVLLEKGATNAKKASNNTYSILNEIRFPLTEIQFPLTKFNFFLLKFISLLLKFNFLLLKFNFLLLKFNFLLLKFNFL